MIVLPEGFVQIKYPGYFWNVQDKKLYSCKIDGILKPLKFQNAFKGCIRGMHIDVSPGYSVSHKGVKRFIPYAKLMGLQASTETQYFPVQEPK